MRRPSAAAFALAAVVAAGCSQKLPVYSLVEDLRVIGFKAEPPTFLVDQPPAQVVVDALVLDPLAGPVDFTWSLCPIESTTACSDFDTTLSEAKGPDDAGVAAEQAALVAARQVTASGTALPAAAAADLPAAEPLRPYTVASFTIPGDQLSALADYFAYNGFFGLGMGAWPSVVLAVARPGDSAQTQKRIAEMPADPSAAPWGDIVREQYHFSFCGAGQTVGCVPWDPTLAANHNPAFASVKWHPGESALVAEDEWQDIPVPLPVAANAKIRLLPRFTDDSFERYQTVRTNLETREIQVVETTEDPSVAWFVTGGKIQDALTWPLFTKTLDTIYTAPARPPDATGGLVTVWLVGRDDRGGETWTHVDLLITP